MTDQLLTVRFKYAYNTKFPTYFKYKSKVDCKIFIILSKLNLKFYF
jgi:hypothetical protein